MAEMGLGYGSEYQLMRFLGHHRNELDTMIQKETGISGDVHWLDYPYNDERISGDGEWIGIECFEGLEKYAEIKKEWKGFWPQRGTAMNWDGVFTIGDTWFFVEAKAHKDESYQKCDASEASKGKINQAFAKTKDWLDVKPETNWVESNCYQLANRLAFLYFCHQCQIEAKLVYIGFVKGFRRKKDEIQKADDWVKVWNEELETLGVDVQRVKEKGYIYFIHPDCEK
ncbi:MAG: hypothetical protein ACI3ZP_09345 [Candidatus Cryptobacteroides sp.]